MTTASIVQRVWNYGDNDLPRLLSRGKDEIRINSALAKIL